MALAGREPPRGSSGRVALLISQPARPQVLVSAEVAADEEEAVSIGNALLSAGALAHVTKDHAFKNEELFYRFKADSAEEFHGGCAASINVFSPCFIHTHAAQSSIPTWGPSDCPDRSDCPSDCAKAIYPRRGLVRPAASPLTVISLHVLQA